MPRCLWVNLGEFEQLCSECLVPKWLWENLGDFQQLCSEWLVPRWLRVNLGRANQPSYSLSTRTFLTAGKFLQPWGISVRGRITTKEDKIVGIFCEEENVIIRIFREKEDNIGCFSKRHFCWYSYFYPVIKEYDGAAVRQAVIHALPCVVQCSVCSSVWSAVFSVRCADCNMQCSVSCMYCKLCNVQGVVCIIGRLLYAVWRV